MWHAVRCTHAICDHLVLHVVWLAYNIALASGTGRHAVKDVMLFRESACEARSAWWCQRYDCLSKERQVPAKVYSVACGETEQACIATLMIMRRSVHALAHFRDRDAIFKIDYHLGAQYAARESGIGNQTQC